MKNLKNLLVLTFCSFIAVNSVSFANEADEMKADISKLKTEIAEIKANLATIKTDKKECHKPMNFLELAKTRYSVRSYSNKEIEKEKLEKILEAGRLAPTARNSQPQHVYIIKSEAAINKIKPCLRTTYGAPVLLLFCYDDNLVYKRVDENNYSTGEMDTSIVCTHMMLEAAELGLGTCWLRGFNAHEVWKAMELPENMKVVCILTLGYPSDNSKPSPMHDNRKQITETASEL